MASASSAFKMKCPSCEASVTIRDASFVGKKVDCPKCKFRFVVEAPPEVVDESDDAAETKPEAKPAAKKTAAPATKAKAKPGVGTAKSKNKPLPTREEIEGDGEGGKKKKAGSNRTLILGVGLGALALIGVVVAFFYKDLFGDADPPAPAKPQVKVVQKKDPGDPKSVDPKEGDPKTVKKDPAKINEVPTDIVKGDITNMLPENSEWVMRISGPEFIKTPFGAVLFEKTSESAQTFKRWMGFSGDNVEGFACAGRMTDSFFGVIRFKNDQKIDDFRAAMEFEPESKTFGRRTLYTVKSNELFKLVGDYLAAKASALALPIPKYSGKTPFGLCLIDTRTLVIADLPALDQFLRDDLKRKFKTTYINPDQGEASPKKGEVTGEPKMGDPAAAKKDGRPSFTQNPSYLSVDPGLKAMLNQLEENKTTAVVSVAFKITDPEAMIKQKFGGRVPPGTPSLAKSTVIGLVVRQMDDKKLDVAAGIECEKSEDAVVAAKVLQPVAVILAKALTDIMKVQIAVVGDPNAPPPIPRTIPTNDAPAAPRTSQVIDLDDGSAVRKPGRRTIEALQKSDTPGSESRPFRPKKEGFDPANPPKTESDMPPTSTLSITSNDKYLIIKLDVDWKPVYYDYISPEIRSGMDMLKGEVLMLTGRASWHSLSVAVRAMEKTGTTPFAAFPRPVDGARFGIPYPPDQRVSWMADLLPSLGYQPVSQNVKRDEVWNSEANVMAGAAWIPEFLSREYPESTWRAHVRSMPGSDLGATHFVGLSGVGPDAANYPDTPEFKDKLGLFGYNRQTKFSDVADGLSNTIFMIQVPPNLQRPWIRGGGSTVQGVPETGSIKPFVCVTRGDKKGTNVLMADGSIRFLSETTTDAVFKALTTYKGGEKIDDLDKFAPAEKVDARLVAPKMDPK